MGPIEFSPPHISHSSMNLWTGCGKRYELQKIQKVPEAPAWYLIGGSAVHKATEWLDLHVYENPVDAWTDAFNMEIDQAAEAWPDDTEWLAGGWGQTQQRYDHWSDKGRRYVEQWYWRDKPVPTAVEADVSQTLPSGLKVKAYVDRVYNSRLVDLKSGSKRPETDQQLGMYTALWNNLFPSDPVDEAAIYMFKDDREYDYDVARWTIDMVDEIGQAWVRGVENRVFLPVRSNGCRTCSMRTACYLESGDSMLTREYDRLNPNFRLPLATDPGIIL